jgi:hypothetical protein
MAGALSSKYRQRCAQHVEYPEKVSIEYISSLLICRIFDRPEQAIASTIYYHINAAESCNGLADRLLGFAGVILYPLEIPCRSSAVSNPSN